MPKVSCYLFLVSCIVFLASCQSTKRTVYFTEKSAPDSNVSYQSIIKHADATIQADDIIAINLASTSFLPDDRPNQVFLDGGLATSGAGGASGRNSYLVDSAGYIDYPRIGRFKMGGLTIREAKESLAAQLKLYLKSPVVEVRIINYRVTLLGEVPTPGQVLSSNHKMTVLDAISSAGGIPITGRKDNVLIIRETNGRREFAHLDLNSKNVFNSPYFNLHQNDIVYVEPSRIRRQEGNEFLRLYLPAITTIISALLTVYAVVQVAGR